MNEEKSEVDNVWIELNRLKQENAMQRLLLERGSQEIDKLLKENIQLAAQVEKALMAKSTAEAVARIWQNLHNQASANFEFVNAQLIQAQGGTITVN